MQIVEGDTFLYQYPGSKYHLFIVVTRRMNDSSFVCTMVSSWKNDSRLDDPACILEPGDHPYIQHKSYVAYKETVIFYPDQLDRLFASGMCLPRDPVSPSLLDRIRANAFRSRKIAVGMKELYRI